MRPAAVLVWGAATLCPPAGRCQSRPSDREMLHGIGPRTSDRSIPLNTGRSAAGLLLARAARPDIDANVAGKCGRAAARTIKPHEAAPSTVSLGEGLRCGGLSTRAKSLAPRDGGRVMEPAASPPLRSAASQSRSVL
jgi:hypothetical protein